MNIDKYREQYREQVVELLKSGNQEALSDAAHCVLHCSEQGLECSQIIDRAIGYLDDTIDTSP